MRRRFERAESGAMAILIALTTCFIVIPLGALAVDLGTQRVSRVDAQAVADTTALDMARLMVASGPASVTNTAATADANQNSGVVGNGMAVQVYTGTLSNTFVSDQSLGCNGTTSNAYFTANAASPTAVLVVVSNSVNFAIHGGSGSVCRSAIAQASQQACMMMDSYAAAINTGDSTLLGVLNKSLGTNIQGSVLSSSGILTAGINVLDFLNVLKTQLGVGSADQVLAANVTAAQVITAGVTALTNSGNTLAAQALQGIGTQIGSAGTVTVSNLLQISQGSGSALSTVLNPFDLAMAAAQLANGTTPISVTATSSNLTGLSAKVTVGSRPVSVCLGEPNVPKTMGQTSIDATANINAPGSLTSAVTNLQNGLLNLLSGVLGTLGGLLGGSTYSLNSVTLGAISAKVSLASATGKIDSLSCNGATPTAMHVEEGSSLVPATISIPITIQEKRSYGLLGSQSEYRTSTVTVTLSTNPTANQTVPKSLALPSTMNVPQPGPANNLSLQNTVVNTALTQDGKFSTGYAVVGDLLNGLNAVVNQIQSTVVSQLESVIMTPLFNALTTTLQQTIGTTIAGSTYTPYKASCNVPKLAG